MKPWIIAILLVLLLSAEANAGVEVFKWDAVSNATEYPVEKSIDNGTTWQPLVVVASSACTPQCTLSATLPNTGYVLVRVGARNANGTTMRSWTGFFHCDSCRPLTAPVNVGVQ